MSLIWKAPANVIELMSLVQKKHHQRLDDASITTAFTDAKPFIRDRLNWGVVKRFSEFNKIWHQTKYDFCLVICSDVWQGVLNENQREPLIDLHLTRIQPEYEPETIIENGRKKVIKDDYGRVKYTSDLKLDDEGRPKWKLLPLDISIFAENIERYGLWVNEFSELRDAVGSHIGS